MSAFQRLVVNDHVELPTQRENDSVPFRINTDTCALEYYDKKWIANSFIDLSFENGLADVLSAPLNHLSDTTLFDGIVGMSDLLGSHRHTWVGHTTTDFSATSEVKPLDYRDAIKQWSLPPLDDLPVDVRDKTRILKVSIHNTSNERCSFLSQPMPPIVGQHQFRAFIYVRHSNNKTWLTNRSRLPTSSNKWQYVALQNERWQPMIEGGSEVEFYVYLPYYSSSWHGLDHIIWNGGSGGGESDGENIMIRNRTCVMMVDTLDRLMGYDISSGQLKPLIDELANDLYRYTLDVIERYHTNNFIHHDLLMSRYNEAILFGKDRDVNIDTDKKYPFLLQYSKSIGENIVNVIASVKRDLCKYQSMLRDVMLQNTRSTNRLYESTNTGELLRFMTEEKHEIRRIAKEVNDRYDNHT